MRTRFQARRISKGRVEPLRRNGRLTAAMVVDSFTGFMILMSPIPGVPTNPLYRMYYGTQFNADGTETDMGYRYLTTSEGEAAFLEGLGRADKRAQRDGAYFRELGVNQGTAILGYVYATTQPGTLEMFQTYRIAERLLRGEDLTVAADE